MADRRGGIAALRAVVAEPCPLPSRDDKARDPSGRERRLSRLASLAPLRRVAAVFRQGDEGGGFEPGKRLRGRSRRRGSPGKKRRGKGGEFGKVDLRRIGKELRAGGVVKAGKKAENLALTCLFKGNLEGMHVSPFRTGLLAGQDAPARTKQNRVSLRRPGEKGKCARTGAYREPKRRFPPGR